jgi:hypothetical protein
MIEPLLKMATSLCLCLQGGKSLREMQTTFASVMLILGRPITLSLPTATPMEQPWALPLLEVNFGCVCEDAAKKFIFA